jgi:hypothetical protein
MTDNISIAGLDKADVLVALYNRARPQGMGFLHYTPDPLSKEEAENHLPTWSERHEGCSWSNCR